MDDKTLGGLRGAGPNRAMGRPDLSKIRAVTFDVGGTLIEPWPSVGHVYAQIAAEHGLDGLDPAELNERFVAAWRAKKQFEYTKAHWSEVVTKTFYGTDADPVREVHFFEALYERFAAPHVWRVFEDVIPTLETLRQRGIKLAAVSNWDERLRPLMRALELDQYFEPLAISGELRVHKPAPEIFAHALRHLRCPAESVLHVGDSWVEDVQGARAAGMHALLLERSQVKSSRDANDRLLSLRQIECVLGNGPA